jgi:hypothetical protein
MLIRDEMYICNFSLHLKSPRGDENMFWKRTKYKYILLRKIPDDAETLIVQQESGELIEYKLSTTSFPTGDYQNQFNSNPNGVSYVFSTFGINFGVTDSFGTSSFPCLAL